MSRTIQRSIARAAMRRAKIEKVNKRNKSNEWVDPQMTLYEMEAWAV